MINFSLVKNDIIFDELILKFILKTRGRNILPNIIYCLMFTKTIRKVQFRKTLNEKKK